MKKKIYYRIIITILLTIILLLLVFLMLKRAGTRAHIYEEVDYTISDINTNCKQEEELLYEDEKYTYYLPCQGSNKIYLNWSDGTIDLVKSALRNEKVTIDSLIEHGLEVKQYEKNNKKKH